MIPFTQELLNQRFRHRYYRLLLKLGIVRSIRENIQESKKLQRLMDWSEVLMQNRINRFAPIIFDCSVDLKILNRWNFHPLMKKKGNPNE